ncbi:MAG: NAD(P)-binding domain-containing protein [Prolixibacteraceae bacterium]
MENIRKTEKVSVIGLGQMGLKLAALLTEANKEVTVWNRSLSKAVSLARVTVARSPEEAISASPVTVLCVYDNPAVWEILKQTGDGSVLKGKTLINFTTGSPSENDDLEGWMTANGAAYLNGAIQSAPDQMGLPGTTILFAGEEQAYNNCLHTLKIFGGNSKYLGARASLSSAMDLATLSWLYGSFVGLIYGSAICESSGLNLTLYHDLIAETTPGITEFLKHEINVIRQKDYQVSQSPLAISVSATQRILDAVKSFGLDSRFPENIALLLKEAQEQGLENSEIASLIGVIGPRRDADLQDRAWARPANS